MSKVAIVPGHGGISEAGNIDPGACGNKLKEADVVKKIAEYLNNFFNTDKYADSSKIIKRDWNLGNEVNECNSYLDSNSSKDIVVEIHCNAADSSAAYGYETFYAEGSVKGKILADYVQKSIIENIIDNYPPNFRSGLNRGIKAGNFYVIRQTNNPAILIECGFVTNKNDSSLLKSESYLEDLAKSIYLGINKYWGINIEQIVEEIKPQSDTVYPKNTDFVVQKITNGLKLTIKAPGNLRYRSFNVSSDLKAIIIVWE
jgi:N-acetylmuramoyl-L-alanine amidase